MNWHYMRIATRISNASTRKTKHASFWRPKGKRQKQNVPYAVARKMNSMRMQTVITRRYITQRYARPNVYWAARLGKH